MVRRKPKRAHTKKFRFVICRPFEAPGCSCIHRQRKKPTSYLKRRRRGERERSDRGRSERRATTAPPSLLPMLLLLLPLPLMLTSMCPQDQRASASANDLQKRIPLSRLFQLFIGYVLSAPGATTQQGQQHKWGSESRRCKMSAHNKQSTV